MNALRGVEYKKKKEDINIKGYSNLQNYSHGNVDKHYDK